MINISFLTYKEVKDYLSLNYKYSLYYDHLKEYEKNEPLFYKFSLIVLEKLPENMISHLSGEDFVNFLKELYVSFESRKKKKFFIRTSDELTSKFMPGNMSLTTITTDDRPFLVDSLREYFYEIDLKQHVIIHPILSVKRNSRGDIVDISKPYPGSNNESFVMVFIPDIFVNELPEIEREIREIYEHVTTVVDDYPDMSAFIKKMSEYFSTINIEVADFVRWLFDDNFIFQGIRVIGNIKDSRNFSLKQWGVYKFNQTANIIPSIVDAVLHNKVHLIDQLPLVIDKAIFKSKVKKRLNYDRVILIDRTKDALNIITIIGVFTKDALKSSPLEISLLRNRIKKVMDYFNFVAGSHDYKWLMDILETFPKIEIFNFDENTMIEILQTIFSIQGKNQIRLYYKTFLPQKNLYLFLAIPSEKYSTEIVNNIKIALEEFLHAKTIDISIREDEHGYDFLHFNLYTKEPLASIDENNLKTVIMDLLKGWDERLYELLTEVYPGHEAERVYDLFLDSFSETYKVKCQVKEALQDILSILEEKDRVKILKSILYKEERKLIIKIYKDERILLTDLMPIIDNTGLKVNEEEIFEVRFDSRIIYIHNIYLSSIEAADEFYARYKLLLPVLIENIITGAIENDRLNKLVVFADLNHREIDLLRAVRNYIEQASSLFKKNTMDDALLNNPEITLGLIRFFNEKFNPELVSRDFEAIRNDLLSKIENVKSLSEDKILRCFVDVCSAMCRTNFFKRPYKNYISFKISSKNLSILAEPKPLFEIYVHSADMEGIHLRGGKVARGGIRFSDRLDDFRTEILGLMKTQMVKNTVIVPVGSKGGFIVKKRYNDREIDKKHIVEQYSTLIKGMLDITDNYAGKKVVHPENVVIYDGNDPYLVVAADKGTATFSDIANEISISYNFWLGDAFASGGSTGYDHKKIAITARGAWECVKRHFMEIGKDILKEEFTVIGIGDMSGDVFGNGMLLSRKIKLIAAFNHMHIFLDPDPDCEKSYTERKRLFALTGSSWKDYDRNIISKGGGVFDRAAKRIELTQEIKALLGIEKDTVTGEELIRYVLMSKAELLWNGGIGTYVKDSSESHAEVGDKQNDNVRINADELNVKVVGEGGNLGFTQKARIKYALLGGKINTDAIDNSAGVDMSDHEVNIKILFGHLLKHKVIKDKKERDKIIMKITPEVVDLVLRDNIEQSRILSIEELNAAKNQLGYVNLAEYLKSIGLLNFELEKIDFIKEKRRITRPELAVLLAYTKLFIYDEVVDEIDITDPISYRFYESYYPFSIIKNYKDYITEHKLVREICATVMVNKFINQNGMVNFLKLHKQYGKRLSVIIQRYFLAEELFKINELRTFIDSLDRKGKTDGVYFSLIEIEKTLNVATEWLLHDSNLDLLKDNLNNFHKLLSILPRQITGNARKSMKEFETVFDKFLLPEKLIKNISRIKFSKPVFDLFEIAVKYEVEMEKLVEKYYLASDGLKLKSIIQGIKKITPSGYWGSANQENLLKKIKDIQKKVAYKSAIKDNWLKNLFKHEETFFVNYFDFVKSLEEGETYDVVPFNVIVDSLDKVVELW